MIYLSLFPKLCPFRRVLSFLQQQFHRLWSFAPFPSIRCDFAKNKFENCGRNKKLQGWVEGWIKLFWPKHLPFLRRNIYHLKLGLRKLILLQKTNNNAVYGTQWVWAIDVDRNSYGWAQCHQKMTKIPYLVFIGNTWVNHWSDVTSYEISHKKMGH